MPILNKDGNAISDRAPEVDPRLRCLGKFAIPEHVLKTDLDEVLGFMKDIVIIRAEFMWTTNCVEYTGISPKFFTPIPEGSAAPIYKIGKRPDGLVVAVRA